MYWYEEDVKRLEANREKLEFEPETLFYGSSSIRMWTTLNNDFNNMAPVNLGFGGSTLAACDWFFERIMKSYNPKRMVVYAGDNDLSDGRHPEELFIFFKQLVVETEKRFGNLPCYFVSLKPSISRWNKIEEYKYANRLISEEIAKAGNNWKFINIFDSMLDSKPYPKKEYFAADGLHLSDKGYELWKQIIYNAINVNG